MLIVRKLFVNNNQAIIIRRNNIFYYVTLKYVIFDEKIFSQIVGDFYKNVLNVFIHKRHRDILFRGMIGGCKTEICHRRDVVDIVKVNRICLLIYLSTD